MKTNKKTTPKKSAKPAAKKPAAKAAAKKPAPKPVAKKPAAKIEPVKPLVTKYETDKVHELELSKVHPGKNVRSQYNEVTIKELAAGILSVGLIQPITVKPIEGKPGEFEVVAGFRRYFAHIEAKLKTINALVKVEEEKKVIIQLIENIQREDMHPMDEAIAFFELTRKKDGQKKAEYTAETLATALGKSKSYVFKRMKLVSLCEKGQELFRSNSISYNHALLLSRLENDIQEQAIIWLLDVGEPFNITSKTLEELRDYLQEELFIDLSEAPFDLLEPELVNGCLACIECPKRTINNETDFPKPEGWDDDEPYDKCTDKTCFFRKLDAHREIAIKENTTGGKLPLLGQVNYAFDNQVKIGAVTHLFSKKKTAEYTEKVVITKQTNGKELIGTVVYIQSEEAKKEAKATAKSGKPELSNGGINKLTEGMETGNSFREEHALGKQKSEAAKQFRLQQFRVLVSRAISEKKEKPFPTITAKQLFLTMQYHFTEYGIGFHEEFILMLLIKWANPDITDEKIKEIVSETEDLAGQGDFMQHIEQNNLIASVDKLGEVNILRLLFTFLVSSQYGVAEEMDTLIEILRSQKLDPEKMKNDYIEQYLKEKEVAAQ